MKMPIKPYVEIAGDRQDRIMSRSGDLVGLSKSRVVWRFGFLPESDAAKAYGVSTESFLWVVSDYHGKVLGDVFNGFGYNLPERFKNIIEGDY